LPPVFAFWGIEMQKLIAKYLLMLALSFAVPAAYSQVQAPDALLKAAAVEIIGKIKQDQAVGPLDAAKLAALVEHSIVPLFDFTHMTRLAMARNWRRATLEQQSVVTDEFKTLLLRSYARAIAQYRDEAVEFKRLRAKSAADEVTVRSEVTQPGGGRIALDYDMEKTPVGWKIYDLKVAGVRQVTTFRDIFAEQVREGGVDGLIKFLADGNREVGSKYNSVKRSFWERTQIVYAILRNMLRSGGQ